MSSAAASTPSPEVMLVPPLMTSGSRCPLPSSRLTNSYADIATAQRDTQDTLTAHDAVIHAELAHVEFGACCVIRTGAVVRPTIRVYVNQPIAAAEACVRIGAFVYLGPRVVCEAAEVGQLVRMDEACVVSAGVRIPDGVWLLPRTWVPPDAVLTPYTVYSGVPASPVQKQNARVYQLLHLEFMRGLRAAWVGSSPN